MPKKRITARPKDADAVGSALLAVQAAAAKLGNAVSREQELHYMRGVMKSGAIVRLIGTPNAETQKEHSASSAEKVVESDGTYSEFLKSCRDSVVERIGAEAEYFVAQMNAQLAVKLATVTAGA